MGKYFLPLNIKERPTIKFYLHETNIRMFKYLLQIFFIIIPCHFFPLHLFLLPNPLCLYPRRRGAVTARLLTDYEIRPPTYFKHTHISVETCHAETL